MSARRTHCIDCGFEVVARAECPLCGHHLDRDRSPAVLGSLFGG